ncbi:MAG: hypothetical protein LBJ10_06330, partial [Clostridiales bacterium]|nr:hypothetical protein [Clostridiales bacterium]
MNKESDAARPAAQNAGAGAAGPAAQNADADAAGSAAQNADAGTAGSAADSAAADVKRKGCDVKRKDGGVKRKGCDVKRKDGGVKRKGCDVKMKFGEARSPARRPAAIAACALLLAALPVLALLPAFAQRLGYERAAGEVMLAVDFDAWSDYCAENGEDVWRVMGEIREQTGVRAAVVRAAPGEAGGGEAFGALAALGYEEFVPAVGGL